MANQQERWYGNALVISSVLMVVTMVLHPSGGSLLYLQKIANTIIIAHSIALVSIPVMVFGFWGFTNCFKQQRLLSNLAFCFMVTGAFAGLCAAAINGLALPLFVRDFSASAQEAAQTVLPILRYNIAVNHAFDFIFIGAVCVAMVLWSIAIVKSKELPLWIGYYGLLLGILGIAVMLLGVTLVDLHGFRFFILGLVSWIVGAGGVGWKKRQEQKQKQ